MIAVVTPWWPTVVFLLVVPVAAALVSMAPDVRRRSRR